MPAFLPAGRALVSWLTTGRMPARGSRLAFAAYRWKAFWFERNWRLQERLYPPSDFEGDGGENLVFVLGFWRSGTTLLHELLALGPGLQSPRTWQCMNPSAFRIAGAPGARAGVARPMDPMIVDALSPQEDEFVLLARGAPSVYRAWLDPRRWQETLPALAQETWLGLPESDWLHDWRTFLAWCMPPGSAKLVLKSPNHLFRLKALHRRWPKARFAWTLRDPADTWFSNRKMWHAMTALYGLHPWQGPALDGLLHSAFEQYQSSLAWAAEGLDAGRLAFVDFDRLTRAPREVLPALLARLGLGSWDSWQPLLHERLERSAQHSPERYAAESRLPSEAQALIGELRELHGRVLASPKSLMGEAAPAR